MQGTPKAIQIQGIVRNATVIGAQDGQAEDLINLRFMDGSWRASGDGRLINFTMGAEYTQLYVHTNVYHHLLGVNNGTLYWFAEIGTDGVTFYPLDNTTSRTNWPQDMQSLPTSPVALTTVVGDIWITQNGHLLTIIDENDDFEHFVFKTGEDKYIEVNMDVNGKQTDRSLYPFGQVHFNCHCPLDKNHICSGKDIEAYSDGARFGLRVFYDSLISFFKEKNQFTQPFMAVIAAKLYDGSYAMASNPVFIHPRERFNMLQKEDKGYTNLHEGPVSFESSDKCKVVIFGGSNAYIHRYEDSDEQINGAEYLNEIESGQFPTIIPYDAGLSAEGTISFGLDFDNTKTTAEGAFINYISSDPDNNSSIRGYFFALGSDLILSIDADAVNAIKDNKDIIQSLCVFVTTESNLYNSYEKDYVYAGGTIPKGTIKWGKEFYLKYRYSTSNETTTNRTIYSYAPEMREEAKVINDLIHSPFYLLREYKITELNTLLENPVVDLSTPEYAGLLKNLVQQNTLPTEALSRTTYLPKVSYMYNGRLHIANYKSYPFFGYPIDLFHLHNHSVKVQADSWFKGVLPNLADNNDEYLQYAKTDYSFDSNPPTGLEYFAYIKVKIDSSQGEQTVVRYIPPYNFTTAVNGRADFIESLNPLLTYPDARAKEMEIRIFKEETTYQGGALYLTYSKTVQLKPHPYLNMAYYIDPDLKPIALATNPSTSSSILNVPDMVNTEEYFPNGLKVSKTDNPMFFPVENAYQVGSAEILALMSNTIAVGTGQTGAAPLYVFCKDGVYALFVDASGQMTYSNSRVLARDVCNNPRSVTPTDAGVVFTTDRGLMMIAGEQVEEIGAPAEGDVVHYTNVNAQGQPLSVEGSKIATDALTKIAGLPSSLCDTTDFLTYLQDKGTLGKAAIINYNHNMRELIISNPNYPYSYVLDREGNWSRRDYTAAEYVNNYPTSYRVVNEGTAQAPDYKFYKLDDEGDASTSLEHRKEADNRIFYLSNVIKLDSIGFKQAYRFVVRGYFEAQTGQNVGIVVEGSYDGIKFAPLGFNRKAGKFTNIGCHVSHTDVRFYRVILCGQVTGKTRIDYMELSADGSKLNTKIR